MINKITIFVPGFVPLLPEHNYGRVHHHGFRATGKSKL